MITRLSPKPRGAEKPEPAGAGDVIRRFFNVIARLDPRLRRAAPEVKARRPRGPRARGVS